MAHVVKLLKIGWLPGRSRRAGPGLALACLSMVALSPEARAAARAQILFAGPNWAAIDFGARCEARTRPLWAKKQAGTLAGFAFGRGGLPQGQFYVRLARPARAGGSVIATIGAEPFLLIGRGQWGWSRSVEQQQAMLRAARYGQWMRIEARDQFGRRMIDRYLLSGAATAIDSAASACAGK